jgi:hypothetical protein
MAVVYLYIRKFISQFSLPNKNPGCATVHVYSTYTRKSQALDGEVLNVISFTGFNFGIILLYTFSFPSGN